MTWNKADTSHRAPQDAGRPKGIRTPLPAPAAPAPRPILDENGEPTMSCFEAMGITADSGAVFDEPERFPYAMEQELRRDCNWPSTRDWHLIRRAMTRDTEAR